MQAYSSTPSMWTPGQPPSNACSPTNKKLHACAQKARSKQRSSPGRKQPCKPWSYTGVC